MTVTLSPELEQIVKDQIATGQFTSPEEVIAVSLKLIRQRHEELKGLIAGSAAQADRGELAPFDPAEILARAKAACSPKAGDAA